MTSPRPALNRTIVGWKRTRRSPPRPASRPFKSHHSGMETGSARSPAGAGPGFKSHHSGMETTARTRVGGPSGAFKSHHSGMETRRRRRWGGVLPPL